jgi:hypothetical protein
MSVVAIYSMKGGVGKSCTAVNLAWNSAVGSARRTLLWDLDPQGAASFILKGNNAEKDRARALIAGNVKAASHRAAPRPRLMPEFGAGSKGDWRENRSDGQTYADFLLYSGSSASNVLNNILASPATIGRPK